MSGSERQRGTAKRSSSGEVPWDSEEDHLLSYFLGGDAGQSQHSHGNFSSVTDNAQFDSGGFPGPAPPVTPAIQFYGSSSTSNATNQHQQSLSSSGRIAPGQQPISGMTMQPPERVSSSSSVSSFTHVAASLVSGGPVVQQMYGQSSKPTNGISNGHSPLHSTASPISPAAIIGAGQEKMYLPTSRGSTPNNPSYSPNGMGGIQQASDPDRKQRHMAWLQQLNTIARNAATGNIPLTHHGPQPQPPPAPMPGFVPSHVPSQHNMMPPPPNQTPGAPLAPSGPFYAPHLTASTKVTSSSAAKALAPSSAVAPAENEERRARRLARNRESARQSRRRKKEHLARLSERVNQLHAQIDTERKRLLGELEPKLQELRQNEISKLKKSLDDETSESDNGTKEILAHALKNVLGNTDPDCPVRRAAASFQYSTLKHLLLPKYQEFLLWLTLHPESFFTAGKEERAKAVASQAPTRASAARVSSKQIGEDITNKWKEKKKTEKDAENLSCEGFDAPQMWPLFCYELSISVDQEEKLLHTQKRTHDLPNLPEHRRQMAVASKMSTNMKHGIMYQSHTVSHKSESALLRILTPEQTVRYLEWLGTNKERCERILKKSDRTNMEEVESWSSSSEGRESSLTDICEKLDKMLRLPESETKSGEQQNADS